MDIVGMIFASVVLVFIVGVVVLAIKVQVTEYMQLKIAHAIYLYGLDCLDKGMRLNQLEATYADMESFDETLWRWWDWGCSRILPPKKYKIIKPYIR